MSSDAPYLWIKTRDGSPTLWSNEISEPFRSTKGAFSESWLAFVRPALQAARAQRLTNVELGEFGLGPGTNWLIWSVAARLLGISFTYRVIEKEPSYFEAGLSKWMSMSGEVCGIVSEWIRQDFGVATSAADELKLASELGTGNFILPQIFASIDDILLQLPPARLDIWFHDPFGFAVNPEGYSSETLAKCQRLWSVHIAGFSYASNRQFRDALESVGAGIVFKNCDTGNQALKRNRSEFYGPLYPRTTALK